MILKLRKKFILINMSLVSMVLLIFFITLGTLTYQQNKAETIQALEHALEMDANRPPQKIEPNSPRDPFLNIPVLLVSLNANGVAYEIDSINTSISEEALSLAIEEVLDSNRQFGTISSLNLRFLIDDSRGDIKIAFADTTSESSAMNHLILIMSVTGIGGLIIFFLISLYLSVWTLRPVEKAWRQQQQFIADASHELKTPLTIILANISILFTKTDDTIGNQKKWLKNTQDEAMRMKTLVDDLLYLAKSDAQQTPLQLSKQNLSDTVWNTVLTFESLAFENGIIIDSNIQSDLMIFGDEFSLKQLVVILMDNACKYTSQNGVITVSLTQNQNRIIFSVNNTGTPIPEKSIPYLFNRFYRVDESRKHQHGSYGLGLSIAQSIVSNHQAKINVKSDKETGTTFEVSFEHYKA